jgi:hypothetical protein
MKSLGRPPDPVRNAAISPAPAFAGTCFGIAAVGDHHAAIIAHRTAERFAALPIGHLQVAEPAAAKVVGRMDPPVCSRAAGLAQAAAIAQMQAATAPDGGSGGAARGEQPAGQGGKEADGLVQTVRQRRGGELGDPAHRGPRGGLLEGLAAWAARQPQTQQVCGVGDPA